MKSKTIKNLIVFGAVIFSLILVDKVSAYYNPYDSSYWLEPISNNSIEDYTDPYAYEDDYYYVRTYPQNSYQQSGSTSSTTSSGTRIVNNYYYQTAPTSTTSSKTTTSSTTKATSSNTNSNSVASNTNAVSTNGTGYYNGGYNYGNGLGASAYDSYLNQKEGSRITALTLKGSGGFMPSSIWQWILVVILILAIIIISRLIAHKRTIVLQEAHTNHAH